MRSETLSPKTLKPVHKAGKKVMFGKEVVVKAAPAKTTQKGSTLTRNKLVMQTTFIVAVFNIILWKLIRVRLQKCSLKELLL